MSPLFRHLSARLSLRTQSKSLSTIAGRGARSVQASCLLPPTECSSTVAVLPPSPHFTEEDVAAQRSESHSGTATLSPPTPVSRSPLPLSPYLLSLLPSPSALTLSLHCPWALAPCPVRAPQSAPHSRRSWPDVTPSRSLPKGRRLFQACPQHLDSSPQGPDTRPHAAPFGALRLPLEQELLGSRDCLLG